MSLRSRGGNEFHGDAFEFVRNTDFDAANYFDKVPGASGQRGAYHQNQFGGTIGGPIQREKVFFFADYQGNRIVTAGNSNYHSLQVDLRHTSKRAQVLVGYTFSKSLDDSSGYGEQINPVNARISRGLSAFDVTNNFVASYNVNLPFDKLNGPSRLTNGWAISGITRFSTGVPVTLIETDDHSLLGTSFTGPQPLPVDTPDFAGGSVGITNPRNSPNHVYFNTAAFTPSAVGLEGNSGRRFFHGPGINNWDMALLKDTSITESMRLEFRAEFFNIFNHAQFLTPSGILTSNFGQVLSAAAPRIGQLSLKLLF